MTRSRSGVRKLSLLADTNVVPATVQTDVRETYSARVLNAFVYGVGFVIVTRTLLTRTSDMLDGEIVRCLEGLARLAVASGQRYLGCGEGGQRFARVLLALILVVISRRCHDDENGFEVFEGVSGI